MGGLITYVAEAVPFDNSDNFYDAENVKDALIENDFRQLTNDPTGFPNKSDSTIAVNNLTRTFTIAPTGVEFFFYIRGKKFRVSSPVQVQWGNVSGAWYVYFNDSGALIASQVSPFDFESPQAFVAVVVWSVTDQQVIYLGEERHGLSMDWGTHKRLHLADGAQIGKKQFSLMASILNGDGSLASHAQVSMTGGVLYDEDIANVVSNSPSPVAAGEQTLSPIARIPLFYRSGPSGEWRRLPPTNFPMATNSPGLPRWNQWTGSTWQLTPHTERYYGSVLILVTNNILEPVIGVIPQFEGANLVDATAGVIEAIDFASIPFEELFPLGLVAYEVSNSFANTAKARLTAISGVEGLEAQTDRYSVLATYNGNANTGRYLEIVPGVGSDVSPFYFPDDSFIRTVTLQSSAASTYTVGFFKTTNLITPVFQLSVVSSTAQEFDTSALFNAGDRLAVRITAGSANSPAIRFWIQTTVGV